MKRLITPAAIGLALLVAGTAAAQTTSVGYPPTRSPYVDLEYTQELSLLAGRYFAHRDPANVGPQGGPAFGVHYEFRPTGPLYLIGEVARFSSDRRLINPAKPAATRELGTESRPLYTADAGLGVGLTGGKTWHHIVPQLSAGLGMLSDFHSQPDSGGFKFGTRFAFTWGGGVRIVPGGRWSIRGDVKNRTYTLAYPEAYYTTPVGGKPVVDPLQAKKFWTNNPTLTLGLSRLF